jgi:hypothetical protein
MQGELLLNGRAKEKKRRECKIKIAAAVVVVLENIELATTTTKLEY